MNSKKYLVSYVSRDFWAGLFLGLFMFGAFMAFGIFLTVQIPVALYKPPVTYSDVVWPEHAVFCAGDEAVVQTHIEIVPGSMTSTFWSTISADNGSNIAGTDGRVGPRLYRHGFDRVITITFDIPSILATGMYTHTRSTIEVNKDSEPAWLELPFAVEECN